MQLTWHAYLAAADGLPWSRFIQAAADNNVKTLEILAVAGTDPNVADYDGRTALHLSVSNNCLAATRKLLAIPGIQVNACDRFNHTPLWDAIEHMDTEHATLLRAAGAKVQEDVALYLCEAAGCNNVSMFELLHLLGINIYCRVRALLTRSAKAAKKLHSPAPLQLLS
jgi:ankyrin repeat protein